MYKKIAAAIACVYLSGMFVIALPPDAQSIQYGQANRQDMLRRGQELNQRAKGDTHDATERMRRILKEKRDGQRGLGKDFMNRQGSGKGANK